MKNIFTLLGLKRDWKRALLFASSTFGVVWGLIECTSYFIKDDELLKNGWVVILVIVLCLIPSFVLTLPRRKVDYKIPNSNTVLTVKFGDLFQEEGVSVIAVNEFWDTQLGNPVSITTLHGKFIQKMFQSHAEVLDRHIEKQLNGQEIENVVRNEGKSLRYPIGSAIKIGCNGKDFILFALTSTELAKCKSSCDVPQLWRALEKLWIYVREHHNGHPVSMPLVGDNLARIGLKEDVLLNLLITSFIRANSKEPICSSIRFILHESKFNEIDLHKIIEYRK